MPFPGMPYAFPARDEVADYLEAYAACFELPVRTGIRVDRLSRDGGRFEISAGERRFEADNLVVTMATHQVPWVPPAARELDPGVVQLHAADYRNPSHLRDGGTLVVGVGNSGAEIAVELARSRRTWLAGQETGHVPVDIDGLVARYVFQHCCSG